LFWCGGGSACPPDAGCQTYPVLDSLVVCLALALHAAYISWLERETLAQSGLLRLQLAHALRIIRKQKKRFSFSDWTRCLFAWYYHWKGATRENIAIVSERTIRLWNQAGFRFFWTLRSRAPVGRPQTPQHIRLAVLQMKRENPRWKAQKIAQEIMLAYGCEIDRKTVEKRSCVFCAVGVRRVFARAKNPSRKRTS
jgi:hypothetical protein